MRDVFQLWFNFSLEICSCSVKVVPKSIFYNKGRGNSSHPRVLLSASLRWNGRALTDNDAGWDGFHIKEKRLLSLGGWFGLQFSRDDCGACMALHGESRRAFPLQNKILERKSAERTFFQIKKHCCSPSSLPRERHICPDQHKVLHEPSDEPTTAGTAMAEGELDSSLLPNLSDNSLHTSTDCCHPWAAAPAPLTWAQTFWNSHPPAHTPWALPLHSDIAFSPEDPGIFPCCAR